MVSPTEKFVLVILGMHRSGTSALSGVLGLFDTDLGKSIMPPSNDNPKGYFENLEISAANERLLEHLGVNWADACRLTFIELNPENVAGAFREEFKKLITDEFTSGKHLLIKDPRMCVLLPFWKLVFAELNLKPVYLLISRNPEEVKASLKKRDFLSFQDSEELWLYYNLCAELNTRGEKRLFISYEDLLEDPPQTVNRIKKLFPFLSGHIPKMGETITQSIEPGLRHNHSSGKPSLFSEEATRLFLLFKEASESDISEKLEKESDDIRKSLESKNIFSIRPSEDPASQVKLAYSDGSADIQTHKASYKKAGNMTAQVLNKSGLHILYILNSFPTVTEMSTLNEITGMVRRGVDVSIVSLKKPTNLKHVHEDVEKYHLAARTFYLNVSTGIKKWKNIILRTIYGQVKLFLKANISLKNKIKVSTYSIKKKSRRLSLIHVVDLINHIIAKKPDVIYFHFATHAGELIILRKIFNIPFVVFFHGYDFSKELPYDALNYPGMFRYGDWFFANSSFSGEKVRALGCPAGKLSVLGLPVDDVNYPFKLRFKGGNVHLLTVARLVEKKGLEYSIRAMAQSMKIYPELQYNIIGEGPLRGELARLIRDLGLSDKIRLLGNRRKDKVIEAMLDSDIFILTSITADDGETEGLGMVLLESQLTGMPVLATLHNGFTDAVRDGISGFLVPEKDVTAISGKLSWLMDHPETWEAMGKAGRKHVLDNYSEHVYMDRILNCISQICKK